MSEAERDIVVFVDDEGNEIELEVLDYFFYNGQEYAVLTDAEDGEDDCCGGDDHECSCGCGGEDDEEGTCPLEDEEDEDEDACGCGCGHDHEHEESLYIMKVVQIDEENEEFQPVDEELMEELIKVVQTRFDEETEDEDEE